MRFYGAPRCIWGGFETVKVLDWLSPALTALALDYGASWIAVLREQGGIRAVLAFVLTLVGRAVYQWARNNSKEKT